MTQTKSLQDLDILIQQISDATGLKQKQISEQLEQASIPSFQFSDAILVSPEDLDPIIDSWAASIKKQILGTLAPAKTTTIAKSKNTKQTKSTSTKPKAVVAKSKNTKKKAVTTQSKTTKKKVVAAGKLSWPAGYEEVVTHLYTPTLKKILPEDANQRQQFIDAINNKTPDGDRLVNELAQTIVKRAKRNLAFDKVLAGLQAKIAEM